MSITQPISFTKMSGSGNDFVVIDNRDHQLAGIDLADFTRQICRRRLSIGADGVVLIERATAEDGVDFRWRYINADGTDGEMCGNGAMCGARFAVLHGIAPSHCQFLTPSGVVRAEVSDDPAVSLVKIAIADPDAPGIACEIGNNEFYPIRIGVPHAVAFVDDPDLFFPGFASPEFHVYGRAVRLDPAFAPAGTNVNIVGVRDRHTLRMRTYERGVENETLACGTGAVASAIIATSRGLVDQPVEVIVSSGRRLRVEFILKEGRATNVTLGGYAAIIATGVIGPDALL